MITVWYQPTIPPTNIRAPRNSSVAMRNQECCLQQPTFTYIDTRENEENWLKKNIYIRYYNIWYWDSYVYRYDRYLTSGFWNPQLYLLKDILVSLTVFISRRRLLTNVNEFLIQHRQRWSNKIKFVSKKVKFVSFCRLASRAPCARRMKGERRVEEAGWTIISWGLKGLG